MQIKQLTLCNFKSFVGEHSFGPFGRFVAIRGFNGNGKSNWFDALAFVLGESKRNLRIKFINELVHSDHQLERSYVRLVVNNGDGQDIEFQRELVQGRIVNTVDQSLVTKLEYLGRLEELRISLINQGMVLRLENLLVVAESSTKELYKLLEPFAGCDTSSDECQRLSDDLAQRQSEIQKVEQQLNNAKRRQKVLRMKKKVSDKNKKNEDEFQLFSQKLALLRLYTIDQKKEDLEKREREYFIPALDVADNIVDQLNRDLETEKSAAEQLKLEIRVNRDEREAKSNELLQRQVQIKHTEKCLKVLQCNLSAKKADLTFQRDRLDKCERCKIEFQAQKIQLEKEIDAKQAEIDGLPTDSLSQDETFLSEYCRLNDQFERNTKKLATECDQLKEQLETVQQVIFVRNESFKSLDCKKEKCEQELSKMMKVRDNHVEADALLASEEQKMAKRLQEDEMKVNELTETLEQLEHDHSNLSKDLLKSKSKHVEMKKLNVISDLMDHYEGVLGRLGDLCTPANKRYRDAFFRVFGSKLSFILVDTIETAKTCIEHLTRNKLKPAYFVCCRAARNQVSLEHLRAQCLKTNAQLLVDCLLLKNESDNELRSVLCRLSKSTFLCESLQEAYEFNEKKLNSVVYDGTLISHDGTVVAGEVSIPYSAEEWDHQKKGWLVNTLAHLDQNIKSTSLRIDQLKNDLFAFSVQLKSIRTKRSILAPKIQDQETMIAQMKNDLITVTNDLDEERQKLKELQDNLKLLQTSYAAKENEVLEIRKTTFADFCVRHNLNSITEYDRGSLDVFEKLNEELLTLIRKRDQTDVSLEYHEQICKKIDIRQLETEVEGLDAEISKLQSKMADQCKACDEDENELKNFDPRRLELIEKLRCQKERVNTIRNSLSEKSKERNELRNEQKKVRELLRLIPDDRKQVMSSLFCQGIDVPLKSGNFSQKYMEKSLSYEDFGFDFALIQKDLAEAQNDFGKLEQEWIITLRKLKVQLENSSFHAILEEEKNNLSKEIAELKAKMARLQQEFQTQTATLISNRQKRLDHFEKFVEYLQNQTQQHLRGLYSNATINVQLAYTCNDWKDDGEILFDFIPPGKTYRPLAERSRGEKSLAALGLCLSLNRSSLLLLDEFDASLDLNKVAMAYDHLSALHSHFDHIIAISHGKEIFRHANEVIFIGKHRNGLSFPFSFSLLNYN